MAGVGWKAWARGIVANGMGICMGAGGRTVVGVAASQWKMVGVEAFGGIVEAMGARQRTAPAAGVGGGTVPAVGAGGGMVEPRQSTVGAGEETVPGVGTGVGDDDDDVDNLFFYMGYTHPLHICRHTYIGVVHTL